MHDARYLHIPVVDIEDRVVGLVGVMDVITSLMTGGGSEIFWSTGMDDDMSDTTSVASSRFVKDIEIRPPQPVADNTSRFGVDSRAGFSDFEQEMFIYKITDQSGNNYRVRTSAAVFDTFRVDVSKKLKATPQQVTLQYQDDEGDAIMIESNESLIEAVEFARVKGMTTLRLLAEIASSSVSGGVAKISGNTKEVAAKTSFDSLYLYAGAGIAVFSLLVGAFFATKNRSSSASPTGEN